MILKRLNSEQVDFWPQLDQLLAWESIVSDKLNSTVKSILDQVKTRGDAAVIQLTNQFDRMQVKQMEDLSWPSAKLKSALAKIAPASMAALETAAARIRAYAEHQKMTSWSYTEADGTVLGQQITALDKVGLYVPGGKAAYPSSVLMNAIPAKVAGVEQLIMVVPTPDGVINHLVLAAAYLSGVDQVYTIGGAQAVAALAYGTETIASVDKITGPGNSYVAAAKRMVFGTVGIDMIAGPSEILVICDGKTDPDWIAMDLFSQAEHDEEAQAILISPDADFLNAVTVSVKKLLPTMARKDIIQTALSNRGALIQVDSLATAVEISNYIAPEHLELSVAQPEQWATKIKHAGAIFMGRYTAEALGDYCAGPNHVLPTSRTARFSSPLGVYDFQKRSSIIHCSAAGASTLAKTAAVLAKEEQLTAHARSAEYRIKS